MWCKSTMSHHDNDYAQSIIDSRHHEVFEYGTPDGSRFYCKHCGDRQYEGKVYVIVCTGTRWSQDYVWTHIVCSSCRDRIEKKIFKRIDKARNESKALKDLRKSMKNLKASLVKAKKMGLL